MSDPAPIIDKFKAQLDAVFNALQVARLTFENEIMSLTLEGDHPVTPPPEPFWVSWPVEQVEPPKVTSEFNTVRDYGKHEGTDCDSYINVQGLLAKVLAAQDGIVEYVVSRPGIGYGNHVVLRHPWGGVPDRYRTLYGHMTSISVKVGDVVKRGDVLGISGNSGTTAIHLHFNVHDAVQGLKGYVRCADCSGKFPDGVINPMSVMRL
jgi:murein DD-endopeptidase MepM/ murein hydrolase activator NlpD